MRIAFAVTAAVFTLAACGGGGSSGNPVSMMDPPPERTRPADTDRRIAFAPGADGPYSTAGLPAPLAADVQHMPIYRDDSRILAGVDQTATPLRSLPVVGERGYFDIRYGRLNDGIGRADVADYLEDADGRHEPPVRRFTRAPMVRVIGGASVRDMHRVNAAVRLVNTALPAWAKMTVEAPLPDETSTIYIDNEGNLRPGPGGRLPPENTIYVEFLPCQSFAFGCESYSGYAWRYGNNDGLLNGLIQINTDSNSASGNDRVATTLLAHEIIHALGREGHADPRFDSIMDRHSSAPESIPQPLSILYPVDREALQALYGALDPVANPQDLGAWGRSGLHVAGQAEHAAFGVALRNGYAEPWAYGGLPATDLAGNAGLSGSAAWHGALLGLTPDAAVVEGDAAIAVNLATMDGRADFTGLETWGANMPPGDKGTGATWLDGDLGYTIAVRGNTFRETGGDDGRLTGIFTGASHEGAAGTLERSDLTAAFGASR